MSAGSKATFLVPRSLTWDKLCALYLAIFSKVQWLKAADAWSFHGLCAAHDITVMFDDEQDRPENVFDVDVLSPYNRSAGQFGSATEKLAKELSLTDIPGVEYLIALMRDNNATGYLKEDTQSLVALIRELFNVGGKDPSRQRRLDAIELLWPAVHAYFTACERNAARVENWNNPFTLNNVRESLRLCGMSVEEARRYTDPIGTAFETAARADTRAVHKATTVTGEKFTVPLAQGTGNVQGHFVESDDTRLARNYLREHSDVCVLIVRRPSTRNVAIFCRGEQSFENLHLALAAREPELWFLDTRNPSPMLLNGSTTRTAPPTRLTKSQLIELVQQHHRHLSRKHQ